MITEPASRPILSRFALAILATVACAACFAVLGSMVQAIDVALGLWWTEIFCFLGVAAWAIRVSGRDPLRYPQLAWPGARTAVFAFLAGVLNFPSAVIPLEAFSEKVLPPSWVQKGTSLVETFAGAKGAELFLLLGAVSIAAPICEEFLFRGVLQQGLSQRIKPAAAIVTTAILFSAMHLDAVGFLSRAELGVLFGVLFFSTRSLWPGVLAHAANNLTSSVLFLLANHASKVNGAEPPPLLLALLVVGGLPFVVLLVRFATRATVVAVPGAPTDETSARHVGSPWTSPAWVIGAVLCVGLIGRAHPHGHELTRVDFNVPLPDSADPTPEQLESLNRERDRADRGEVPVSSYEAARRKLIDALNDHSKR